MKYYFKDRLKEAMSEKGLRAVDVVEAFNDYCTKNHIENCKVYKSMLSMYLSGKFEPNSQRIAIFAKLFDVSEAWLIGYDVPKGTASLNKHSEEYIDTFVDKQLLEIEDNYKNLNEKNRMKLSAYIQALIDSQEE